MARNTHFGENHQGLQVETNKGSITYNQSQTVEEIDRVCLRHLRCPDSRLVKNRLKESKDKLLPESFDWILRDEKYESWRDGDQVCLLWIKGGAGKGKTMIAIGLVEALSRFCNDKSSAMTYFFCQNSDSELNTLEGMMKGLILQLLHQQPALRECIRSRWNAETSSFDEDLTSWRALWHILLEMIDRCDCSKLYLVLDALDECHDGDMDDFLKALVRNGLHSPARVKWLLTSRPLDSAERSLLAGHEQVQLSLELESDRLSSAVKAYITHKVNELGHQQGYERPLKKKLESELQEKSEGTFLWVSLVCKMLEDVCPEESLAAIQNIPHGLQPLYGQVFRQLGYGRAREVQMCMRLLKVMMLAYRPLTMEELATIAALANDEDVSLRPLIIRCASFLRLQGQNVEFVHQSARDYLAGKDAQLGLDSHGTFGHYEIFLSCLDCLSNHLKVNLLNLRPDTDKNTVEKLQMNGRSILLATVEYAAIFWGQHLRDSVDVNDPSQALDKSPIIDFLYGKFLEWLECLSVLDMLPVALSTLQLLEVVFKDEQSSLLFLNDSIRFISWHYIILDHWPAQVYACAVIWSPESSVVRKRNLDRLPWLRSVSGLKATWGSRVRTFIFKYSGLRYTCSSDGKRFALIPDMSHLQNKICVLSLETGIMHRELPLEPRNHICQLSFSQDNQRLIWISKTTNAVQSWEITSEDVQSTTVEYPGFGKTVALSSTSMQVASVVSGHGILIWDIATEEVRTHIPLSPSAYDQSLFFSIDGKHLVCDFSDKEFCIWDTTTGRLQKTLRKPPGFLHCSAHSPDGSRMAYLFKSDWTKSERYDTLIWDTLSGRTILIKGEDSAVCFEECLKFSPDGKKIAFGFSAEIKFGSEEKKGINVWDVSTDEPHKILSEDTFWDIQALAFSSSGQIISFTRKGQVDVWDVETPSAKQQESSLTNSRDIAFSYDGKRILRRGLWKFMIVDARTGLTQKTIPAPVGRGEINTARFLPGSENIVLGLVGGVMIWEAAAATFQWLIDDNVSKIAPSPNGKYLAGIPNGDGDRIRIWNIRTGALRMTLKTYDLYGFHCLAFSPDSKQIVSRDTEDWAIWDVSRSLRASKFFGDTISSHIPCIRPKKIKLPFETSWSRFSSDDQHILWDEGAFAFNVNDFHEETDSKEARDELLPYLYLNKHGWICYGGQAFIRLPWTMETACQDRRDERFVIGFNNRGVLVLDIDTTILSEMFAKVISHQSHPCFCPVGIHRT
ncbi:unnamed protein product [Penicillium salamii]|uniref:NACHT domain-containing protein n=1 Tax=Penicillium salamii TaxID=1612424 RepID=A0A9W4J4A3_9EURO|nr:unnamed protein product [Penicillium salamii]